jgi:CubicO group peptidase (beta-lactamase class C family)
MRHDRASDFIMARSMLRGIARRAEGRSSRVDLDTDTASQNITSNTPITEDTVFRIASITKTFRAIALMQL